MPIHAVVQILTASIAPVIVISGVGLLLLSITNRYGRVIDRARLLMRELQDSDPEGADVRHLEDQLRHTISAPAYCAPPWSSPRAAFSSCRSPSCRYS